MHAIAGLDTPIFLPDDVEFTIDLIPFGQRNQRPGFALRTPSDWIQHETGNYRAGADALMHSRYMDNGAPDGNGVSQMLGYHFTTDDKRIIQKLPINEVSYQAADGGGDGNFRCISNELCVHQGIDKARSRRNAEYLAAGVLKALGRTVESVGSHWTYNYGNAPQYRHRCPELMMFKDNYWPTFVANIGKIMFGDEAVGAVYVPGTLPDWFTSGAISEPINREYNGTTLYYARMTYTALKPRVYCRAWASATAPQTRSPLKKGETFEGIYRFKASGVWWILSKYGSRIRASHCSPFITIKEVA